MAPVVRQDIVRSGLGAVIARMEASLEEPVPAKTLAAAAGLSLRQLERSFRRHLATTPNRYYLDLRLQRARALLQYSDLSVLEIAIACGFGSAAHFSRSYRGWAGKPPSADRGGRTSGIVPALR